MKTLGVTIYKIIDDEQGKRISINNGFSFGFNLFGFTKHIFANTGMDCMVLKKWAREYDRIYCSILSDYDLNFLKPILDSRWILGGPLVSSSNIFHVDLPCDYTTETVPGYFKLLDYDFSNYSIYFESLMHLYPKVWGIAHASLGGKCYWKKCEFCSYSEGPKRPPILGESIVKILEKADEINRKFVIDLAIPAILPKQLETVMGYSLSKKHIYQFFLIPNKEIINTFSKFDNKELKNCIVCIGVESPSRTNRELLNKGTKDSEILECIEHIVRLDGSLELFFLTGHFNTTKRCVKETRDFLTKLERIAPPYKIRPYLFGNDIVIRWQLEKRRWLEKHTDFPLKEEVEVEFGKHIKVPIPENSNVYKYNNEIESIMNNSPLSGIDFDLYFGELK